MKCCAGGCVFRSTTSHTHQSLFEVTISGIVNLDHIYPDTVDIIDFKTNLGRHAEDEDRKQLSVYYHVLAEWFPDRDVTAGIFYTAAGDRVDIDPFSKAELVKLTRETIEV